MRLLLICPQSKNTRPSSNTTDDQDKRKISHQDTREALNGRVYGPEKHEIQGISVGQTLICTEVKIAVQRVVRGPQLQVWLLMEGVDTTRTNRGAVLTLAKTDTGLEAGEKTTFGYSNRTHVHQTIKSALGSWLTGLNTDYTNPETGYGNLVLRLSSP